MNRVRCVRRPWTVAVVVVMLSVAACGGGGGKAVRSGTTPTSGRTTTSASVATTGGSGHHPAITVTPATDLVSNQQVQVSASGYSPNQALVLTQCADKGTATGMGDCNLAAMQTVSSDANGEVHATLVVSAGPFGTNRIVCNAMQPCLVSLTQATPSPTEEADTRIAFR